MADAPPSEYPQTPTQRWNANIEALRAAQGRWVLRDVSATPEEVEVLAQVLRLGGRRV